MEARAGGGTGDGLGVGGANKAEGSWSICQNSISPVLPSASVQRESAQKGGWGARGDWQARTVARR